MKQYNGQTLPLFTVHISFHALKEYIHAIVQVISHTCCTYTNTNKDTKAILLVHILVKKIRATI